MAPRLPVFFPPHPEQGNPGGCGVVWAAVGCRAMQDFTLLDQARQPWTLSRNLDAGVVLVFLRGDW